ncbi:MAG: tetratricopeptide repeat protein [Methylacidiphilales bacterium]|nr:tetratricopeptide repeat protein [Candidatus Methylacidiphilales bacterium]
MVSVSIAQEQKANLGTNHDPSSNQTSEPSQKKLTEDSQPMPGSELLPKALQLFLAKKFNESLEVVDQILKINPNHHHAYNLKGANYTKMKNWSAAESAFRQALSVAPNAFEPKFNLAELLFLQGQYAQARQAFTSILHLANLDIYKHLTEFKIFLTYLLEDQLPPALEIAKKYDGFETTPIYYFVQGALAYKEGNRAKAMENFDAAARIFPAYLNHNFADTLIELGWIQVNSKGMLDDPDAPKQSPSITNSKPKDFRPVSITPARTPVGNLSVDTNSNGDQKNGDAEIKNPFNDRRNMYRETQ